MWRTSDEWEKIIKEAYTSDLPLKRWCLEHNIKDITFRKARERLLREGKLRFMEEKVLLPIDESRKWVRLPSENIRAILVLEPIRGNLSMESMASIIALDLDLPLIPGQIFFFIEKKWKQIYALKICKNGYCLFSRKLEYGTFYWPKSHSYARDFMYRYEYDRLLKTIEN